MELINILCLYLILSSIDFHYLKIMSHNPRIMGHSPKMPLRRQIRKL